MLKNDYVSESQIRKNDPDYIKKGVTVENVERCIYRLDGRCSDADMARGCQFYKRGLCNAPA